MAQASSNSSTILTLHLLAKDCTYFLNFFVNCILVLFDTDCKVYVFYVYLPLWTFTTLVYEV